MCCVAEGGQNYLIVAVAAAVDAAAGVLVVVGERCEWIVCALLRWSVVDRR